MKPKLEYINNLDKCENKQYYIFAGGRGSGKSYLQMKILEGMMQLREDIKACNFAISKMERRNNEEKNNCVN